MSDNYDYIVVGAGAAGSIVAARLAQAKNKVLLLESGADTRPNSGNLDDYAKTLTESPMILNYFLAWMHFPINLVNETFTVTPWHIDTHINVRQGDDSLYQTTAGFSKADDKEPSTHDIAEDESNNVLFPRYYHYPRASGAGGCVQHHAMVHGRGSLRIYDRIAKFVNDQSWNSQNIARIWHKIENYQDDGKEAPYHSTTGWLKVRKVSPEGAFSKDLRKAAEHLNVPVINDFNDPNNNVGFGPAECQTSRTTGKRSHSWKELIDPLLNSGNEYLTVKFNSLVSKVLIEEKEEVVGNSLTSYVVYVNGFPQTKYINNQTKQKVLRATGVEVIEIPFLYSSQTGGTVLTKTDGPNTRYDTTFFPYLKDTATSALIGKDIGLPSGISYGMEATLPDRIGELQKKVNYKRYYTNKEVIVSGGAVQTPQILMLSGIGEKAHLQDMQITCVNDLPGVGRFMLDHNEVYNTYSLDPKKFIPRYIAQYFLYALGLDSAVTDDDFKNLKPWTGATRFHAFGLTNFNLNHLTVDEKKALKAHYLKFVNGNNSGELEQTHPFIDNNIPHMVDWHSMMVTAGDNQSFKDVAINGELYDDPDIHIHFFGVGGFDFDINFTEPPGHENYPDYKHQSAHGKNFYKTNADGTVTEVKVVEKRQADGYPMKANGHMLHTIETPLPDPDNKMKFYGGLAYNSIKDFKIDPVTDEETYNVLPNPLNNTNNQTLSGYTDRYGVYRSKETFIFSQLSVDATGLPQICPWGFLPETLRNTNKAWAKSELRDNLGSIRLRSNHPGEQPIFDAKLWKNDESHDRLAKAIILCRRFMNSPYIRKYAKNYRVLSNVSGKLCGPDGKVLVKDASDNWCLNDATKTIVYKKYMVGGKAKLDANLKQVYQVQANGVPAKGIDIMKADVNDNYTLVDYTTNLINEDGDYLNPTTFTTISEADTWYWENVPGRANLHGTDPNSSDETTISHLKNYLKKWSSYGHHVAGTCGMGPNPNIPDDQWVVDSKLNVRNIKGLRVADTSVYPYPELHGYNTSTAAYVVGEMCAEFILSGQ